MNLTQTNCNIVVICCGHSPPGKKLHKVPRPGGGACLGCPAIQQLGFRIQAKSESIILVEINYKVILCDQFLLIYMVTEVVFISFSFVFFVTNFFNSFDSFFEPTLFHENSIIQIITAVLQFITEYFWYHLFILRGKMEKCQHYNH